MKRYLIGLALACAALPPAPAVAADFKFLEFQAEPLCGDNSPLPFKDQTALGSIGGTTYLAHYRMDGEVKELTFSIDTPGAFQGDPFPEDICGSTVVLSLDGGPDIHGVMEYLPPVPGDELSPWPYAIKLEWPETREMRFSGSYSTAIWGAVEMPAEGGGFELVFFTGARLDRWE